MLHRLKLLAAASAVASLALLASAAPVVAQERLPWLNQAEPRDPPRPYTDQRDEEERPVDQRGYGSPAAPPVYVPGPYSRGPNDAYTPARPGGYANSERSRSGATGGYNEPYREPAVEPYDRRYGSASPTDRDSRSGPRRYDEDSRDGTFSADEIKRAGHSFFGSISQGLASIIEYAFKQKGRPNGYILGEDVGGAFVAGLRYGEGMLTTKDAGSHKVYWQGPSIGYDFGGEGSKVMVLVYNLRDPADIYDRFGGVAGSAYVVGGVGLTFQTKDDIVLAPIRAGIGLRLGANVGYLKYTPRPTWNPF